MIDLRPPRLGDVDDLWRWECDDGPCRVSRFDVWQYIVGYIHAAHTGEMRFVIERRDDRRAVGCIDLTSIDSVRGSAEVGIYIAPQYRRHGYASAAVTAVCDYAAGTLHLHNLSATVSADNLPSRQLFTSAGFIAIPVSQTISDHITMEKLL